MDNGTSTLLGTEQRYAPVVLALCFACMVGGAMLLWACPNLLAVMAWLALTASNVWYLVQHGRPTVGMMPVAVFSLAPASLTALCAPGMAGVRWWLCATLCVFSFGVMALFVAWFFRLRQTYAHRRHTCDNAMVIVLGGGVRNGLPRPTLARRLDVAAELCKEHAELMLVLTGGPLHNEPGTEADAMARYLVERGISRGRLLLERRARNTHENIVYGLQVVRATGRETQLCVLTSDYHLYRAVREGRGQGVELTPIPAKTRLSSRLQQWCREVLTIWAKR